MMQIGVGYELVYDCPQPTPMLLMLNVHYTRISDMVGAGSPRGQPSIRFAPIAMALVIGAIAL